MWCCVQSTTLSSPLFSFRFLLCARTVTRVSFSPSSPHHSTCSVKPISLFLSLSIYLVFSLRFFVLVLSYQHTHILSWFYSSINFVHLDHPGDQIYYLLHCDVYILRLVLQFVVSVLLSCYFVNFVITSACSLSFSKCLKIVALIVTDKCLIISVHRVIRFLFVQITCLSCPYPKVHSTPQTVSLDFISFGLISLSFFLSFFPSNFKAHYSFSLFTRFVVVCVLVYSLHCLTLLILSPTGGCWTIKKRLFLTLATKPIQSRMQRWTLYSLLSLL